MAAIYAKLGHCLDFILFLTRERDRILISRDKIPDDSRLFKCKDKNYQTAKVNVIRPEMLRFVS